MFTSIPSLVNQGCKGSGTTHRFVAVVLHLLIAFEEQERILISFRCLCTARKV